MNPPLTKTCRKCKDEKPFDLFTKDKKSKFGRSNLCKSCNSNRVANQTGVKTSLDQQYRKAYYAKNKEKINLRRKTNYNPETCLKNKINTLRRKYNLTIEDFQTLKSNQENKCYLCGLETTLVIDHNHETGKVRALLCNMCNIYIGGLEYLQRQGIIHKAIEYIS